MSVFVIINSSENQYVTAVDAGYLSRSNTALFVSHSFRRTNDLDVQLSASGYVSKKTEKSTQGENDDFEEVWI